MVDIFINGGYATKRSSPVSHGTILDLYGHVIGMRACKRAHDNKSCTRLQNYTTVYTITVTMAKLGAQKLKIYCS